jgi:thiol:disulfide interchange protein DsbD
MISTKRAAALAVAVAAVCGVGGLAIAKPWWMRGVESNESDFLPPDVAFRTAARVDGAVIRLRWVIADGYYLYRRRMDVKAESPDLNLSAPVFPPGTSKTDPYLGTQEVYFQQVDATVPFSRTDGGAHPIQVKVTYQGCAEAGLCYPPITKVLFADAVPTATETSAPGWELYAIGGGGLAFLFAGLLLRKGRRLDTPAM